MSRKTIDSNEIDFLRSALSSPHSRRAWLRACLGSGFGMSSAPWLSALAEDATASPTRKRSCILLCMTGGPSQTDTFDTKPEHTNGGEFKIIETSVSGI
jgi:hypothetical protein